MSKKVLMFKQKTYLIIFILVLSSNFAFSQTPYFIEKKPLNGEGTYAFLRRYKLDNNSCNFKKFLTINNLKRNAELHKDTKYKLPILIYQYNSKSIRSTIGNNNFQLALQIQEYNRFLTKKKLRLTDYTKSKILWVRWGDLNCKNNISPIEKEETIIPNLGTVNETLFGKKYEKVTIKDKILKNRVFYIVAGHGGPDPGARYVGKKHILCEDEYAYDVSLRLAKNLLEHGAIVHIIIKDPNDGIRDEEYLKCDKDEISFHNKPLSIKQKLRLRQRTKDINVLYKTHKKEKVKSQLMVSIHVDARNIKKRQDVFFYYYGSSKSGKKVALSVQKIFKNKYKQVQRGREYYGTVTPRSLYVLKHTYPTAFYIELGNIKNTFNQTRLKVADNRQALANWIYLGVIDTY